MSRWKRIWLDLIARTLDRLTARRARRGIELGPRQQRVLRTFRREHVELLRSTDGTGTVERW